MVTSSSFPIFILFFLLLLYDRTMKIRAKHPHQMLLKEVNPVIRFLIVSDVLIVGAAAMLAPLFALFVEDFIVGGDAMVISIAMAIYLFSRSILQIPIATLIDKIKGEKDDYFPMVFFSTVAAVSILTYLIIDQPWQLFLVQLLLGISTAATYPSYMAIFTRHIDKHKEGTEWGIYYTFTDLGSAVLAMIGGFIVTTFGFSALIVSVAAISVLGSLLLVPIRSSLRWSWS